MSDFLASRSGLHPKSDVSRRGPLGPTLTQIGPFGRQRSLSRDLLPVDKALERLENLGGHCQTKAKTRRDDTRSFASSGILKDTTYNIQ